MIGIPGSSNCNFVTNDINQITPPLECVNIYQEHPTIEITHAAGQQ